MSFVFAQSTTILTCVFCDSCVIESISILTPTSFLYTFVMLIPSCLSTRVFILTSIRCIYVLEVSSQVLQQTGVLSQVANLFTLV